MTTTATCSRTLVLSMDSSVAGELAKLGSALASGGLGVGIFNWWRARRRRKQQEPIEFTARILDDGDKLRELLLAETRRLQTEREAAVERAHQAELKLAVAERDNRTLQSRLERKDEQAKALQAQIINLGQVPVILTGAAGRSSEVTL